MTFGWRKGNETLSEYTADGIISTLRVGASEDNFGIYMCYVNNSIGAGIPCEADVQGTIFYCFIRIATPYFGHSDIQML